MEWLTCYYRDPCPDRFVQEIQKLSANDSLSNHERFYGVIVFLSQVMAANVTKLPEWFAALRTLSPDDIDALALAVWLSAVPNVKFYLDQLGRHEFSELPPKILELPIDKPCMLDALWGYFFATGDLSAIRKIVAVLDMMPSQDLSGGRESPTSCKNSVEMRGAMHQAASWSLSNCLKEHPRIREFCGELVRTGKLTPSERYALAVILATSEPGLWHVEVDPGTKSARITWTEPPL